MENELKAEGYTHAADVNFAKRKFPRRVEKVAKYKVT